jgi:hypothetical protein
VPVNTYDACLLQTAASLLVWCQYQQRHPPEVAGKADVEAGPQLLLQAGPAAGTVQAAVAAAAVGQVAICGSSGAGSGADKVPQLPAHSTGQGSSDGSAMAADA